MATDTKRPQWFFYPGWVAVSAISLLVAIVIYWVFIRPIVGIVGDRILVGGQHRWNIITRHPVNRW